MDEKTEIRDYQVEFDGEEPVDVNALQAALIIQNTLDILGVSFDEIKIKQFIKYTVEITKEGTTTEFPRGEPKYWYVEADLEEKMLEVGVDDYVLRIPLFTILKWFSTNKDDER